MSVTREEISAAFRGEIARARTEDILTEVRRIQAARGCDFETAWRFADLENPGMMQGSVQRAKVSAREAKIEQDPRLAAALLKLKQLEDDKTEAGIDRHVKFLAMIKKLQSQDSSLTFDAAMVRILREHPELWPGAKEQPAAAQYSAPIPSSYLVTAESAVGFEGLPDSIQYMPGGRSVITPSVNGMAKTITVNVGPGTAARLQADLTKLLAQNVRPFIDFEHGGGRAAALPKRFFWKDDGVWLAVDWTQSGKSAVLGKDFAHFSATFLINEDGEVTNLPSVGAIGSLVNNPAFRSGRRLMAAAYSA